ncbi:MAG TPA: type IV secretion system DNA-binding domain-containing protein [Solirubrobacteraceae bacterium]|jgi:hypothetical protein
MMGSSEQQNEPAVNPLALAEQLIHRLTITAVHLAIGLAIGLVLARTMRRHHLRWTWAGGALMLVVLARRILGADALVAGTASLCAAVLSWRWHSEDLDTGADMADLATARLGPLDVARLLARGLKARRSLSSANSWWKGGRLTVGHERNARAVTIPLGSATGGTHTLVVGATRSGKTVTMTWMVGNAIESGMGAIVIDPKGDRDLRGHLRDAAAAGKRQFIEWSPRGSTVYNPYARGSETEIADKALAGERFTEPHYLRQAQRYLGHEVRVLRRAGTEVDLRALVEYLQPQRLEMLARSLPEAEVRGVHAYMDSLTPRQQSDLAGVRDRLAIMSESDIGPWLDSRTPSANRLDLLESTRARAVVYFNLQADSRPLLAQMLGAAIIGDLQTVIAGLQGRPEPTIVAIDEFSAIAPERVVGLFARAGGAGVSLVLGTQELADMRIPGREMLLEQVVGNLSVLIAHRQVVPGSARLIAEMTETTGVWKTSRNDDRKITRTRALDHSLRAGEVMSLSQGCAAVIALSDGGRVSVARMLSVASAG